MIIKGRVIDELCEFVKLGVVVKEGEVVKLYEVIEIVDLFLSLDSINFNCNVIIDCEIKEIECMIVGELLSFIV